jgi:hypothetical protein
MRPPASRAPTFDPFGAALFILIASLALLRAELISLWIVVGMAISTIFSLLRARTRFSLLSAKAAPSVLLFVLAVGAIGLASTPLAIGGVHPIWSFVGGSGAGVIDRQAAWLGLLQVLGLVFAFITARISGQHARSARSLVWTLLVAGAVLGFLALRWDAIVSGRSSSHATASGWLDPAVACVFLGVVVIFALETLIRAVRRPREAGLGRPPREVVGAAVVLLIAGGAFVLAAPITLLISGLAAAVLFVALTLFSSGDLGAMPKWVRLILAPAFAVLAAIAAVLFAQGAAHPPLEAASSAAYAAAFMAAPWCGYGLGSGLAVDQLIMTSANMSALIAYPKPSNSYLVWVLQGGLVALVPLLASAAWAAGVSLVGSLHARPMAGIMRASACSTLFLMLAALTSAGPASLAVETLLAALLGLSVGAAES